MKTIGYIGLGIMGLPMALNLLKSGKEAVKGFDIFEKQRTLFAEQGGLPAETLEEVISEADILFLCLPTNELVEETVQMILEKGKTGAIIVDNSSTAPGIIRRLAPLVKASGKALMDAPVSGGQTGAQNGTLVIMCGGEKQIFDQIVPYLDRVSSQVTYMGGSGCGSVAKLVNNMIAGIHLGALGEAFSFGVKAGLDPETLFRAIRHGFAQSAILDAKAPKLIAGDYTPSARAAVHQKDLKNAMMLADELGVAIPLSQYVLDEMNHLEAQGDINLDHCAVAKIYEQDMGVSIAQAAASARRKERS